MIKHCQRLPLAIRVLGGLLTENYTVHYWKQVSENIGPHLHDNNSLNSILSLRFEELPGYLKHCFLYFAHFPEDYEIDIENLSYYWAADGILRYSDGETIQDVGESYIDELVRRSMVISERDNATSRFEKCCLHDLMRELCMSKAKEENFLSPSAHPQSLSVSQRFFTHDPYTLDVEREINNSKVRSLVVVQKVVLPNSWMFARNWKLSSIIFTRLQLLRILLVYKAEFEGRKLPDSIGKLIHLRYLNIEAAGFHIRAQCLDGDDRIECCNLEDLRGMARLKTLVIALRGEISLENLSASIGGLGRLENLTVDYYGAKGRQEWIILDFNNLRELSLSIKIMLSAQLQFPSRITRLSLEFCSLVEDPMPVLEKLSQLKFVTLGSHSFLGRRMVCSAGVFPQLQKLELFGLVELEEWIIDEGSMPVLHTLQIDGCKKLNKLPDGLQLITSLKKLTLRVMGNQWNERLSEGGEDYYKVQHIPSVSV
ncbi:hypothetical protein F2Q69_00036522 [Brassica cretica]|uniref:NB-ARC domain-containing protein n=1 Tax=Brassica cretica TaxID=69181 RepID=A0A8S9SUT3_BRACR|nr:hypothetical protein F2Q69_00036522 [Brassica cretica]